MIRAYEYSDFNKVKELLKKDDEAYLSFFTKKHYAKFVAIVSSQIVGVAVISITLGTGNLDFIYVSADMRSKGIGKKLVNVVEQYCLNKNAKGLGVNCGQENKKAQLFYRSKGFKKVGKVYNYFSNKNWQLFFWKKL